MAKRFRKPRDPNKPPDLRVWFVYVIQSLEVRFGKTGKQLPEFHYVGSTTDPARHSANVGDFHKGFCTHG